MRLHCLRVSLVLLLGTVAQAAEQFPYTAYLNADDVYIRSGPGQNHYPTSKLPRGEAVEVYRHDPGGWFAIRPPEGSFSWVSAKYLQSRKDGIAVVTGERVVSRIGSEFSDIRDVIQVRLDRGEEVEILDTKEIDSGNGPQPWCKISPVAGEFRWVSGKFVDRSPPQALGSADDTRNLPSKTPRKSDRIADDAEDPDADSDEPPRRTGFRPVSRTSAPSDNGKTSARTASQKRVQLAGLEEDAEQAPTRTTAKNSPSNSATRFRARDLPRNEQFLAEVEELDWKLSNMVVEEPTAWSFDELRPQAETLVARGQTAVERGHARLLLSKITRFEDIKARYGMVAEVQAATDVHAEAAAVPATATNPSIPSRRPEPPRYDGSGRLASVLSQRVGAPQYALLDETGAIRMYVSATPGSSLKQFVGQNVGIVGIKGYHPEMNAAHLTARQVTVLKR